MKIYVAVGDPRKRKDKMKFSLHQNWWKISFDALLCRNWPFLPPNSMTLWRTLISYMRLENKQPQRYVFD